MATGLTPPNWIDARPYQEEAVKSWLKAGGQGTLRMATGTGKTITSLLAAARVARAVDEFLLAVAVPYQHLVDQWSEDVREFGIEPVLAYESRAKWQPKLERQLLELNNGLRDVCVVVTTHKTLSGEATQKTVRRVRGRSMLIGDEVHHMGASHTQNALMDRFDFRLGLSATPERWYDEEGTEALNEYFGETVFDYDIDEAIDSGFLCEYYYIPHIVELQDDEMEMYLQLSRKIGRLAVGSGQDVEDNKALQTALFKRARLIGTAREKVEVLLQLISAVSDSRYSLVYCGGGSMTDFGASVACQSSDSPPGKIRVNVSDY
jgi:superfamily II DNA or RNA helicase